MPNRLRIHNYNSGMLANEPEHGVRPPQDRYFYAVILLGVLFFFGITYPYRDIRLPSLLMAFFGFFSIFALMLASYLRPQYYWASIAFCIYIPYSGEYPGDFGQMILGVNFTNILILPVIVQWMMQRSIMNERLVRLYPPDLPLLLFCIFSSLSVLRVGIETGDVSFNEQFVRLKRWLFPFLIYFVFLNIKRNDKGVKYLIIAICVNLTAIAILTMKESFDIGPGGTWDRIRVRGVLGSPNGTGAFFVYYTLLFLGLFLCYWRHSRWSWILLVPFLLCGRAMTLANSRGGLIAFTIALLATLLLRSRILFAVGLTVVILGYHYPQYLPETVSGRLFSTLRPRSATEQIITTGNLEAGGEDFSNRLEVSAQGRLRIWKAGLRMVGQDPWMGRGYGEFPNLVGYFGADGTYDPLVAQRDPHNSYLGIAAEMGVFALFFFVLTLVLIFRSCLYVYHYAPDLFMRAIGLAGAGMMLGVMSANFFGSRLDTTELTAYLWILSAIIVQYQSELARKRRLEYISQVLVVDPWRHGEAEEIL